MSISWDASYSVGDATLDAQHKELIQKITVLEQMIKKSDPLEHILGIFDYLNEYAFFHFRYEEHYMQNHSYPKYAQHKAAHETFITELQKLEERYKLTPSKTLASTLLVFMQCWLESHVHTVDHEYKLFIDTHINSHPSTEKKEYHKIVH